MKLSDKQFKFAKDVAALILFAAEKGYKITLGEVLRPKQMQKIYLSSGKTQVKISQHQKKLAIDINLFVDGVIQWNKCEEWSILGDYWKSLSPLNRWGGDFKTLKDYYHFEQLS